MGVVLVGVALLGAVGVVLVEVHLVGVQLLGAPPVVVWRWHCVGIERGGGGRYYVPPK